MPAAPSTLSSTPAATGADSRFRAVQRRLATVLPDGATADDQPMLEFTSVRPMEPPRLIGAQVLEGSELRAIAVAGEPTVGFAAFLDGTQTSKVIRYVDAVIPIVHGTVAAVIRRREARRLTTWRHAVDGALYAPRTLIPKPVWNSLAECGVRLIDTTEPGSQPAAESNHPFALNEIALHRVQKDREAAEHALAHAWCSSETEPLFADGGINGNDRMAREPQIVGVVKSHRTLYAEGDALRIVMHLKAGERSSVFRVTSPKRSPVASWYLRLRDNTGRDPLWGLVRVEIAEPAGARAADVAARAEEVSRWILAEVAPVALPDARWDKMVYGIRDCEEFLKAVQQ